MSALNGSLQTMCAAATALDTFTRNATSGGRKRRCFDVHSSRDFHAPISVGLCGAWCCRDFGWLWRNDPRDQAKLNLYVDMPPTKNSSKDHVSLKSDGPMIDTVRLVRLMRPPDLV